MSVDFSPDGKFVISGSKDNTIRIWDVNTGLSFTNIDLKHKSMIWNVTFHPNNRLFSSSSEDGRIKFWEISPLKWHQQICQIVNRNFSKNEWQRFIGDALPYQKTCPDHPAPGDPDWVEPYTGS